MSHSRIKSSLLVSTTCYTQSDGFMVLNYFLYSVASLLQLIIQETCPAFILKVQSLLTTDPRGFLFSDFSRQIGQLLWWMDLAPPLGLRWRSSSCYGGLRSRCVQNNLKSVPGNSATYVFVQVKICPLWQREKK